LAARLGSFLGKIWRLVSSWGRFGGGFLPGEDLEAGSFLGKLRRQASQLLPTSYIRRVPFGER